MNIQRTALPVIAALLIAIHGGAASADSRSEEDRARDAGRKPFEVVAFIGIEPGMNVLDVMAASGWYTEVLSVAVGPEGHVTAQNTAGSLQRRDGANEKAITARLADDRLPNVSRLNKETHMLNAEDGPFDAALTALNLHDIYNSAGEQAAIATMTAIYATLKPGGVFGVIDHQGLEGQDNAALHRMLKADAIRVAEAAGFTLEADSDILYSDIDDMTQHMRTEGIRGYTNRFLLRLRKPE
jgi:predicted methyltransferase